jgi:transcriptional regulator with XRE-family HTH domain
MKPKTKLGEYLAYIRTSRYVKSQKEFAESIGISSTFLTQIETGERPISPKTILNIINVYKLTPEEEGRLKRLRLKRSHPLIELISNCESDELDKIYKHVLKLYDNKMDM